MLCCENKQSIMPNRVCLIPGPAQHTNSTKRCYDVGDKIAKYERTSHPSVLKKTSLLCLWLFILNVFHSQIWGYLQPTYCFNVIIVWMKGMVVYNSFLTSKEHTFYMWNEEHGRCHDFNKSSDGLGERRRSERECEAPIHVKNVSILHACG